MDRYGSQAIASVAVLMMLSIVVHRAARWQWPYYVPTTIVVVSMYLRM